MNCTHNIVKYLLFGFNFLFWVLGVVVLGVGAYSRVKWSDYDTLLGEGGFSSAANLLIASGTFVLIIGFLGCCGAYKENKPMLMMYFVLVFLIFILEIAAGALAYSKKDAVEQHLNDNLQKIVHSNYGKTNPDTATQALEKALDFFQKEMKCCGAVSYTEWSTSIWGNTTKGTGQIAPLSCCKKGKKGKKGASGAPTATPLPDCNKSKDTIWTMGCIPAGKNFIKDNLWKVGGVGIGIAFVQLLVMAAAVNLCRSIGKEGNLA